MYEDASEPVIIDHQVPKPANVTLGARNTNFGTLENEPNRHLHIKTQKEKLK